MSNQQFNFPPPPPPPAQAPPYYPQSSGYTRGNRNDRYGRGNSTYRGRGRGGPRGGSRGDHDNNLGHTSGYGGYLHMDQRGRDGISDGPTGYGGGSYPLPDYPQVQQPHYHPSEYNVYSQPASQYTPQPYQAPQPQPYPSYRPYTVSGQQNVVSYEAQPQSQPYGYGPPANRGQYHRNGPSRQPVMMGPPIHIGSDGRPTEYRAPPYGVGGPQDVNRMPLGNHSPRSSNSGRHESPNPYAGRGRKRNRSEAFRQPNHVHSRPQAAPAVPSFGKPLPVDLPTNPHGTNAKRKKKKRRHNQLGLTPKTEEHESSEEEDDDLDEEAKLAASSDGQYAFSSPKVIGTLFCSSLFRIQITFNDRTLTLQSSTEIAEWIAERKKKFPTKARAAEAEERRRRNQEEQRAARQAAKESQDRKRAEAAAQKQEQKIEASRSKGISKPKDSEKFTDRPQDSETAKAQAKVDKLRRRLEKEERRIAKAQAKASKTKEISSDPAGHALPSNGMQEDGGQKAPVVPLAANGAIPSKEIQALSAPSDIKTEYVESEVQVSVDQGPLKENYASIPPETIVKQEADQLSAPNPLTPTSQPSISDAEPSIAPNGLLAEEGLPKSNPEIASANPITTSEDLESEAGSDSSMSTSSSDISSSSEDDDETSSSDGSSSDDAPEAATSKRTAPEKVPPPKREKPKSTEICRRFLKTGRCPHGESCNFRHELPDRRQKSKSQRKTKDEGRPTERKTLHQRVRCDLFA